MKKPERLVGFINYNEIEYPFELDNESFSIKLYPPTMSVWEENSSPMRLLRSLREDTKKKHEWVMPREMKGITSERYHIVFNVKDVESSNYGFISFEVNWYIYYTDKLSLDKVDGFQVSGHDVDLFYPPLTALKAEREYNKDGHSLEKISVSSNEQKNESCGRYRVGENIDADIDVTAYASFHSNTWLNPIDSISCMITTFSIPVGIETVMFAFNNLRRFFEYVTYRHNVYLDNTKLFYKNEEGLRELAGTLVIRRQYKNETLERAKERIIKYRVLTKKSAELFTAIKAGELGFQHLCDSIEDMQHYQASRIIMILATFEREYRNIYGIDKDRSEEYLEVKNEVVSVIDTYRESKHGAKRRYAGQLARYVETRDNSFETNVKSALMDCEPIMSPFVRARYHGSYIEEIEEISSRMGEVRNGIAHSKLDLRFDAIHLSDIKVIEELIYAIRLKHISISNEECQKAIHGLFGE